MEDARMMRGALRACAIALMFIVAMTVAPSNPAFADGIQDQSLATDPGCLGPPTTPLRATAPSTSVPRQEVVPSMWGLTALDVCLSLSQTSHFVSLRIRGGTAAAPGPELASRTIAVPGNAPFPDTKWVHIDLLTPIATPPGQKFVVELSGTGLAYAWRGTCGQVAMPDCPTADADQYTAGVTNAGPTIGDFGFRTYDPGDTDLDGMPDGYEILHAACLDRLTADASGNPDTDGATSGAEFGVGSDPCVANPDSDGDGCTDFEEGGTNPGLGGMRNPALASDFYDVNGSKKVDGFDIGQVRLRFNPTVPTAPADAPYDRSAGAAPWAPGLADNVINAVDISRVRASFNHTCIPAP
jgi:hypothetical protein